MAIIARASPDDIRHVCHHLRALDQREAFATRFDATAEAMVEDIVEGLDFALTFMAARPAGQPHAACLIGAHLIGPRVAGVAMLATNHWPEVALGVTRWVHREMLPLLDRTVNRSECRVWEKHHPARRWLKHFGFTETCLLPMLGKHGETYVQVERINPAAPLPYPQSGTDPR